MNFKGSCKDTCKPLHEQATKIVHSLLIKRGFSWKRKFCKVISMAEFDQVVSVQVWKSMRRFDPTKSKLTTYCYKYITTHAIVALIRYVTKCKKEASLIEESEKHLHVTYDQDPSLKMIQEEYLETLRIYDPRCSEIVRRLHNGDSRTEIASDFGMSTERLRQLLNKASVHLFGCRMRDIKLKEVC